MKFKTLKDFRKSLDTQAEVGIYYTNIVLDMMKAEAIKWVKYWRDLDDIPNRENEYTDSDFMNFFNITEEDLK